MNHVQVSLSRVCISFGEEIKEETYFEAFTLSQCKMQFFFRIVINCKCRIVFSDMMRVFSIMSDIVSTLFTIETKG